MLKSIKRTKQSSDVLAKILQEIRLMRQELNLILPQDDLKMYEHAERIKQSYQNAIKQYPTHADQTN